jgi:hypothetical protein
MTIAITALATFLVTALAGIVLDYIRHARPKISYSVKDAVPIELDGKCIGAYQVSLSNVSKRVVKDVSCHIKAGQARLRDGGVSAPQGLQYSATETDSGMQISIPYLRPGDGLQATVIGEGVGYLQRTPDVAIRSPQDINVALLESRRGILPSFQRGFYTAAVVAGLVAGGIATIITPLPGRAFETPKDVFTFSASVAGLPHLAELYSTSSDLNYYNQGDLAYALAVKSNDPAEIGKYRRMIAVALETAPRMMPQSRASLHYSLGKIDLLLSDNNDAIQDFRQALDDSKGTVDARVKVDPIVREFLAANGLR